MTDVSSETRGIQGASDTASGVGGSPSSDGRQLPAAIGSGAIADRIGQQVHNFTGTPREVWRLTALACGADCLSIDEVPADGVQVKYIYMHDIEIQKDDGEAEDTTRTVLITPEEKCYAFVSAGVALDAYKMLQAFGNQPINPPELVKVRKVKTRKGRTTISLTPA